MCIAAIMSLADVASAAGGAIVRGSPQTGISAVTTDSRAVVPGGLFVALAGERFDGHDFVAQAASAGAAAVLVQRAPKGDVVIPTVQVADTRLALGKLASWWRERFQGPVAALTGSNGKTTVKEMTAAILREACGDESAVLATEGNLNNDIGMPLTLLKLRRHHRYAVIEMGMNHLGEIDYLTHIARPDVALVNNAHRAHVGELGSVENIARAKGEIFAGLGADGIALISADDKFAAYWADLAKGRRQLRFGLAQGDVRCDYQEPASGTALRFTTPIGTVETTLQVPGEHNVRNATAACAIAVALGIAPGAIARGLAGYAGTKGRLQRKAGLNGAAIIDDTYNANPESMAAAIAVLARVAGAKVFVMGDMGELGEDAEAMHAEVGALAKRSGIDRLLALGDFTPRAAGAFGQGGRHFATVALLVEALRPMMDAGTTVLVKGSRFMRMEQVVEAISTPAGH